MQKKFPKTWFIYAGLSIITLAVFWQVHKFDFTNYDDDKYVIKNPNIVSGLKWENIVWVFKSQHVGNWHPLTGLSHLLDCEFFKLNAGKHHIVSLIFHLANVLLLFTVFRLMTDKIWHSAFAAALFAIHPLHVESVAWISERKDVLSTFFLVLTMLAYFKYIKKSKAGYYMLALAFFVLGLMAKPMLVTLPFLLLLLDYWPLERFDLNGKKQFLILLREKIPFFVLSAVSCVVTFIFQKSAGAMVVFPLSERIQNAIFSYVKYIAKMFYPVNLAPFYPYNHDFSLPLVLTCGAILIFSTIAVILLSRKYKYLATGWFWYLGTLVPVIGLIQVGEQALADRYTYIPLIGLFVIFTWGIIDLTSKLKSRKILLTISSVSIILVLLILARIQTSYWQNSQSLFEHTLKVTEDNYLAYNNLSVIYLNQNKPKEASILLDKSLKINPDYAPTYNTYGQVYEKLGRIEDEIKAYETSINCDPKNIEPYYNLGLANIRAGRFPEAISALKKVVQVNPSMHLPYLVLGRAYGKNKNFTEEIACYKKAIELEPRYLPSYNELGAALGRMGKIKEAINILKEALKMDPNFVQAHYNLLVAYFMDNDKTNVYKEYEIIKKLSPRLADEISNQIPK